MAEKCNWFRPAFDSRWRFLLACVRHRKVKILWRMGWWWLTNRPRYCNAWGNALFFGVYDAPKMPKTFAQDMASVQPMKDPPKDTVFKLECEYNGEEAEDG